MLPTDERPECARCRKPLNRDQIKAFDFGHFRSNYVCNRCFNIKADSDKYTVNEFIARFPMYWMMLGRHDI